MWIFLVNSLGLGPLGRGALDVYCDEVNCVSPCSVMKHVSDCPVTTMDLVEWLLS